MHEGASYFGQEFGCAGIMSKIVHDADLCECFDCRSARKASKETAEVNAGAAMANDNPAIWSKKKHGLEFSAHADGCVYVALDWNGTLVWDYCCPVGKSRDRAAFVKYLRAVADKLEQG
jgi:hypothetical protein